MSSAQPHRARGPRALTTSEVDAVNGGLLPLMLLGISSGLWSSSSSSKPTVIVSPPPVMLAAFGGMWSRSPLATGMMSTGMMSTGFVGARF